MPIMNILQNPVHLCRIKKLHAEPISNNNKDEFPVTVPMVTDPTIYPPSWEEFVDNILTIEGSSNFIYIRIRW